MPFTNRDRDVLDVAVVGAGIGGLAVASFLLKRGATVRVFDQARTLSEVGAGVIMTPNSRRLLEREGFGGALADVGAHVHGGNYFDENGAVLGDMIHTDSSGWNGMWGMHRADFIDVFAATLPAGIVATGHRAVAFGEEEDHAWVRFSDGSTIRARVVVGADGIHSVIQSGISETPRVAYSGMVAYRGLLDSSKVDAWHNGHANMWLGKGMHFLTYPVRRGELLNYVAFVPAPDTARESWSEIGDPDELRAAFADWDPRVTSLLAEVDTTFWWSLNDRPPRHHVVSRHMALLGDAAHPMLPHVGQGANQAIEDAYVLARLLDEVPAGGTIPETLAVYQRLRVPRVTGIQEAARLNGQRFDHGYVDPEDRKADLLASGQNRQRVIFDYDADADIDEARASAPTAG